VRVGLAVVSDVVEERGAAPTDVADRLRDIAEVLEVRQRLAGNEASAADTDAAEA
jgi:hypothetical protein